MITKVSDSIGRKNALLICLGGALTGYAITLVSHERVDAKEDEVIKLIRHRNASDNEPVFRAKTQSGRTSKY
jgi:hypothetical protein